MISVKALVQVIWSLKTHRKTQRIRNNGISKVKKAASLSSIFLDTKLLYANVQQCIQCVYKVSDANNKTLVQVDFPVCALSEMTQFLLRKNVEKRCLNADIMSKCFLCIKYLLANVIC